MYLSKDIYVGGQWVASASDRTLVVRSPSTEEVVGEVPDASPADIDAAVGAARSAFDSGPWPRMSPVERAEVMLALLDQLSARLAQLETVIAAETGTPRMLLRPAQIDNALDVLRYYAGLAGGLVVEAPRTGVNAAAVVRREPVGTVAAIIPWNAPLFLSMMKVAPAMAAGCTVVLKAAPETPVNAYLLAEAADAAGVPPGVLNVLATGPASGERLVTHPGIDKIAFTGSTAAGRRIAGLAGEQLKHVTLELGGKSAAIVLDDADLDAAMLQLIGSTMSLSGQMCIAQSRILVSRERYDEAVERFAAVAGVLPVGDPLEEGTFIGPLISRRQRERVLGYIAAGREAGAVPVVGGGVPSHLERGWYVEPTVFRDVSNDMSIAQEEIFGPVVVFIPYTDVTEAVSVANDSPFGLHGTVWTSDLERGLAVGREIRTGTFGVNGMTLDAGLPFGGVKSSGLGRECGPEGLDAYLDTKTIFLPAATEPSA